MKTRHNPSETPVSSRGHLDGFGYFGQQCSKTYKSCGLSTVCLLLTFAIFFILEIRMIGQMVRAMSCLSQYSYFKNAESAPAEWPDRDVVPHPGVVFEAILQAFGHAQFAACIEAGGAEGGAGGYVGAKEAKGNRAAPSRARPHSCSEIAYPSAMRD